MLISFAVENFRSYREQQVLSLLATDSDELPENTAPLSVAALRGRRVLRSAAIYGANASGKSNLIRAFRCLCMVIGFSAKETTAGEELPIQPHGLSENWTKRPTRFSTTFIVDDVLFVYEVSLDRTRVHREELTEYSKSHPRRLFVREVSAEGESVWRFSRTHFRRDQELERRTRPNSLFLSVGALFNHETLTKVSSFFTEADIREPRYANEERELAKKRCVEDAEFMAWASQLLNLADTGVDDVRATAINVYPTFAEKLKGFPKEFAENIEKQLKEQPRIEMGHRGSEGNLYWWPLDRESDGTQQLLSLLRSWYGLLRKGSLVWVDELDDSLHPLISRQLLKLLGSSACVNKSGQLIFTTHDTTLLDRTVLRRDQIFFTEKASGATKLYSLIDYAPRRDEALQKGYLAGRYGAIPFLGVFEFETPTECTDRSKEASTPSATGRKPREADSASALRRQRH